MKIRSPSERPPEWTAIVRSNSLCASRSRCYRFHPHPALLRHWREQVTQSHQVVGGHGKHELEVDFAGPAIFRLPQPAHGLAPTKTLLNAFADLLAEGIPSMPAGAPIKGRAPTALMVLGQVRSDVKLTQLFDEPVGIVGFVGTHRKAPGTGATVPTSRWRCRAQHAR